MKRILPFTLLFLFSCISWFFLSSHSDGVNGVLYSGGAASSGIDRTGGPFSSGATCVQCHSGGAGNTTIGVVVKNSLGNPVTSYTSGATYTVEYQVANSSYSNFAFQGLALSSTNTQAGTFSSPATSNSQISTLSGRQYPEHSGVSSSGFFSFTWVAPSVGTGTVTFYAVGNAVNANGGTSGDKVSPPLTINLTETPPNSISYGNGQFCDTDADPTPVIVGPTGGTFSPVTLFPIGATLSVNSSSGVIDISASNAGAYIVTYNYTGGISTDTVVISPTFIVSNSMNICDTDSIFLAGGWQNSAGTYVSNLQTVLGCDSIVTTTLSIIQSTSSNQSMSICDGETAVIGGMNYTTAGTYSYVVPNAAGCDSTITTVLSVNPTYNDTITETICQGDSSLFNGVWYSVTGMYVNNDSTALGCDSLSTLDLTVSPLDLSITAAATVLTSGQAGATYRWLDCDAGNTVIAGATSQSYTAIANGNYAVEVTFQNCTDTSICETVGGIGLEELSFGEVKLYPNPSNGELNLNFNQEISADIKILDLNGKVLSVGRIENSPSYKQTLDLAPGTYIVSLKGDNASKKILWVVK